MNVRRQPDLSVFMNDETILRPFRVEAFLFLAGITSGKSLLNGAVSGLSGEHNEKPLRPVISSRRRGNLSTTVYFRVKASFR
jgi:hypothetical protein